MGLQNQLSDVSSESIVVLMAVLIGKSKQSNDGVGSDCVVCLNRMGDGDRVRKLACRHVFHKDCFDGWLDHLNFSCPLCRAPLVAEERVKYTQRRVAGDLLAWFHFH
ncbi:UNVERIFIED_CONTAM: E3 ubiquitin-protein ligase RHA2A [Sesamum radiatum]|uniref:E3 ubiquitin-protein ligase RHA2A n=1 Tax=Sesamum radiatum TaxID=300843 RepID=A0AAW2VN60_SESRA